MTQRKVNFGTRFILSKCVCSCRTSRCRETFHLYNPSLYNNILYKYSITDNAHDKFRISRLNWQKIINYTRKNIIDKSANIHNANADTHLFHLRNLNLFICKKMPSNTEIQ